MSRPAALAAVRARLAVLDRSAAGGVRSALPFGDPDLDAVFPQGGLPLACWHELAGEGLENELSVAPAALAALMAAPLARRGAVIWVSRRDDLHPPGLAGLGFPAERMIRVRARDQAQVMAALEDALGQSGVAAVLGEADPPDLLAGRRLQLACERSGATGFLIRRRAFAAPARPAVSSTARPGGTAAATRWRVSHAPSEAPRGFPGLGAPRWRVELERCRGGRCGGWILEMNDQEMSDGSHPLRVVTRLGDRQLATPPALRRAG